MTKHDIFKQITDLLLFIGSKGKFKVVESIDRAIITGLPSVAFNYISFGSLNHDLLTDTIKTKHPFMCFPQQTIEEEFPKFCEQHGLIKADDVLAHSCDLTSWEYKPNNKITIKQFTDEESLNHFDYISSIAFQHPLHLAKAFLKVVLNAAEFQFFLAYDDNKPVGAAILSSLNNEAGLYWDGVLPEYRNRGIASELVKYRMNIAKNKGHKTICSQNMSTSKSYYQKIGFKPAGSLPLYVYLN